MWDVLASAGGGATIAGLVVWAIIQFAKMRSERPGPVNDAATANQVLASALDRLEKENTRLLERVQLLEDRLRNVESELRQTTRALHEATANGQTGGEQV